MARARARSYRPADVWPGYVDALATLLLTITFFLTVYVLAQFFLTQALSGGEKALERLSREVQALSQQLAGERSAKQSLESDAARLRAEVDRLAGLVASSREEGASLAARLDEEKATAARAVSQVDLLNEQIAALRQQLAAIAAALDASEAKDRESQLVIADLGQRLQVALAEKVAEMARYRSEFFGRLREVLGDRPEVRTVGDRFVFQAEVLFPSGSADLTDAGKRTLSAFARTLLEISKQLPPDVPWVLRVDGHTDRVPISSPRYPSNWELSVARAMSVVKYLLSQGVAPQRLAATGFGEFQPIDAGTGPAANSRNRRIEMRLTDR